MINTDQFQPSFEKHPNPFLLEGLSNRIDEIEAAIDKARSTNPSLFGQILLSQRRAEPVQEQYTLTVGTPTGYDSIPDLSKGAQVVGDQLNAGSIREQIMAIYEEENEGQGHAA